MKSRKKHVLDQALAGLPQHKAPEKVWEEIEQALDAEKGLLHLDRAITEYKAEITPAKLPWNKVEQELKNQEILSQAIHALPTYTLDKDVFEDIINKTEKKEPQHTAHLLYWIAGIAASLILLIGFLWKSELTTSAEKIQITYREEALIQTDWQAIYSHLPEEDELLQFIRENCVRVADQCQEPAFKGLLDEYLELNAARQELINELKTHREQTQLATYLVRIEKEKTAVGKKLIQQLLL